jgi:hypothetical protein
MTFSYIRPVDEVKLASSGFISVLGNIRSGLSNFLNLRENFLKVDFAASSSLPLVYDTDLENFWTQTSKIKKVSKLNLLS